MEKQFEVTGKYGTFVECLADDHVIILACENSHDNRYLKDVAVMNVYQVKKLIDKLQNLLKERTAMGSVPEKDNDNVV